jgi:hypothetical protein
MSLHSDTLSSFHVCFLCSGRHVPPLRHIILIPRLCFLCSGKHVPPLRHIILIPRLCFLCSDRHVPPLRHIILIPQLCSLCSGRHIPPLRHIILIPRLCSGRHVPPLRHIIIVCSSDLKDFLQCVYFYIMLHLSGRNSLYSPLSFSTVVPPIYTTAVAMIICKLNSQN